MQIPQHPRIPYLWAKTPPFLPGLVSYLHGPPAERSQGQKYSAGPEKLRSKPEEDDRRTGCLGETLRAASGHCSKEGCQEPSL